jgi:hypothetical protein
MFYIKTSHLASYKFINVESKCFEMQALQKQYRSKCQFLFLNAFFKCRSMPVTQNYYALLNLRIHSLSSINASHFMKCLLKSE